MCRIVESHYSMVAFSLFSIDFLNGIFKSETDRVNKYTGNDPVIEEEVKKMGGFGAALAEKNRNEGIGIGREQGIGIGCEQEQRERIEVMLRKGLKPEEVANYGDYPLALVKEVEKKCFLWHNRIKIFYKGDVGIGSIAGPLFILFILNEPAGPT